ncbi:MAG: diaminopimelate dehydrogenase, partial [Eubacterium sp.]|nr:diaminopimelate dehydrogenase [Eubacterium sp.]
MRIGILGYGNLGRGVEKAVNANEDQELLYVFTRRNPEDLKINTPGAKVLSADELSHMQNDIDVLIICGGSATDLPKMTPKYAKDYNVIDSFDTHANIPTHFAAVDNAAKEGGKIGVISCGWDPGMFSVNRLYSHA